MTKTKVKMKTKSAGRLWATAWAALGAASRAENAAWNASFTDWSAAKRAVDEAGDRVARIETTRRWRSAKVGRFG